MKETFLSIIKSTWPTLVIFLSIVTIIRIAYLKHNGKKIILHQEIFFLIFIAYILLLYQLVTFKENEYGSCSNLMPFKEIFRYDIGTEGFYNQVIGNIILLIPFGFFVTDYVKITKIFSIFLLTLFTSTVIETTQYFIGRCFDIDDIILNVLGGTIGFLIYVALSAIRKHLPGIFQKDWFYSIISFLLIVFIVLYFLGVFEHWSLF